MARQQAADFLVEIGTEELPPKGLKTLMEAFAVNLGNALDRERLAHGELTSSASPRRLAVRVRSLAAAQDDRESELRGPPVSHAFDNEGAATAAANAFAKKCGVDVTLLGRTKTGKGEWLSYRSVEKGQSAADLLPGLVQDALDKLPVPRRMRWGDSDIEFVRPVHWVLMLYGSDVITGRVMGLPAGNVTRGHRFLSSGDIVIEDPSTYLAELETKGFVLADYGARRERIVADVLKAASSAGGIPLGDDALYDEVTALTEWPVALTGRFDESYLKLPREVIIATLTGHQRYFPLADDKGKHKGKLMARFVVVANLASNEPDKVRDGNERVIRPRLADAAFFWEQDRRTPLADRREALEQVVYQQGLGSLRDKSDRVGRLAALIATELEADEGAVRHAASLSRCDLLTGMVGEFPELQGVMGRYYAKASGEPDSVADALEEFYLPRFAGDRLPSTSGGRILSLADKLDSLSGNFALGKSLGKSPSGNRDPFGLRRASLAVVRILVEQRLDLDLPALLEASLADQPVPDAHTAALRDELYDFIVERMRGWYADQQQVTTEVFEAVRVRRPASLLDFDERLKAVAAFVELEPAASLSAANKRIANILRQAGQDPFGDVDTALLGDPAEKELYRTLQAAERKVRPSLEQRAYRDALGQLAELRDAVDRFFDEVMVMTDDVAERRNRLALLAELRALFLQVADISRLSIG